MKYKLNLGVNMKKILAVGIAALFLTGCKVDVETKINTDDLLLTEHKVVVGNVEIEVPSCNDYQDSRLESKSLIDLKQKIPTVFKNIEYVECYKRKFNSYAQFTIPIGVGLSSDKMKPVAADIYLLSNDSVYLGAMLLPDAVQRLKAAKKDMPTDLDIGMTVILQKGQQPIPNIAVLSSYMTGIETKNSPIIIAKVAIEAKEVKFKLSDISNNILSEGKPVPILVTETYFEQVLSNLRN